MRFNNLEAFFGQEPESQLPKEIFHNDKALHEYFLKYVGKEGWVENQIRFAEQQALNNHNESRVTVYSEPKLVGTDSLSLLAGNVRGFNTQFDNLESLKATWALHFLQLPVEKIPHVPGGYFYLENEDKELPKNNLTDQIIALEQRLFLDPTWALALKRPTVTDIILWTPEVLPFLQELGLLELYKKHSKEEMIPHWQFAIGQIASFLENHERFLYPSFVIDAAFDEIVHMIPEWETLSKEVKDRLVVHLSYGTNKGDFHSSGDFQHLLLEQLQLGNADRFTDNFLTTIHEITHAMVDEFLFGEKPLKKTIENFPQLVYVLQEAAAITIEQSTVQLHDLKAHQDRLPEWVTTRIIATLNVLQMRKTKDLSQIGTLTHYTEGVRLAKRLAKEGWKVEDLPKAVALIRDCALEEKGTTDPTGIFNIAVTNEADSEYQRILSAISKKSKRK